MIALDKQRSELMAEQEKLAAAYRALKTQIVTALVTKEGAQPPQPSADARDVPPNGIPD